MGDPGLSSIEGPSTAGFPSVVLLATRLLVRVSLLIAVCFACPLYAEGPMQVTRYVVRWPGQATGAHAYRALKHGTATVYSSACWCVSSWLS